MKKYILILLLNWLILCCNYKQEMQAIDLVIDIEEIEEIKITPNNFIKNSTYIQLETNENCLIGNNIEKLVVKDNQIFILDSNNKIFVFDTNGVFLNTIGEKGGGPNEQLSIVSFYVHPIKKYIAVFDNLKQTVFKYSYNGILLDKSKYDNSISEFYNVDLLSKKNKLIFTTYNEDGTKHEYLLVNEENMKLERKVFPYLVTNNVSLKYGFPRITVVQDTCFILTQYSDIIQKYHNDKVNPYLYVNTHLKQINKNTKFTGRNETGTILDFDNNLKKDNYSLGLEQISATDEYLYVLYNDYHKNKIYHIFRDIQYSQNYSITLSKEFYKYPIADIVSFGNFKASTNEYFITVFMIRDGFREINEEIINENESIKEIRSKFEEDGNPIIVFINMKQIFQDAKE